MAPNEAYVATEAGVRLFVQKLGNGPQTVVIPNGLYLIDVLDRFASQYTLLFCDPRNRGRSDHITDRAKLERGIHRDVEDLEAIRFHFGLDRLNLIGHSYMGVGVALYAMKYPDRAGRVVQIGAPPPDYAKQYPAHLTNTDGTLNEVLARLGELQKEHRSYEPREFCRKFWSILRVLYVVDPADADRLKWEPCDLPNEVNFMPQWNEFVFPSIQKLNLTSDDFAKAGAPVLGIHGRKDRSSSYGGGRDWVLRLPNARLVTLDHAAHAPWIEEPEKVFSALEMFLDGKWPVTAEKVDSLDPAR